jgi:purine-cytosine permease-like protein
MPISDDCVLSYLRACAEKCNEEQRWVVAAVTTIDGAFVAAAAHLKFSLSLFSIILVIAALLCGGFFIWRRHYDYYFYRDEIAKMLKAKNDLARELQERANRETFQARSGALLYSFWIFLTSVFAVAVLYRTR